MKNKIKHLALSNVRQWIGGFITRKSPMFNFALLKEDDFFILTEDGFKILLEDGDS